MRNLVVHRESIFALNTNSEVRSITSDNTKGSLTICTSIGEIIDFPLSDGYLTTWNVNNNDNCQQDNTWFHCSNVAENNSILCVSKIGQIVTIQNDSETGDRCTTAEVEGVVDRWVYEPFLLKY